MCYLKTTDFYPFEKSWLYASVNKNDKVLPLLTDTHNNNYQAENYYFSELAKTDIFSQKNILQIRLLLLLSTHLTHPQIISAEK